MIGAEYNTVANINKSNKWGLLATVLQIFLKYSILEAENSVRIRDLELNTT